MKSKSNSNLERNFIFNACMNSSDMFKKEPEPIQQMNNNKIRKKHIGSKTLGRPLSLNDLNFKNKLKFGRQNNPNPSFQFIQQNKNHQKTNFDHYLLSKSSHPHQQPQYIHNNDLINSQHIRKSRNSGNKIKIFSNQPKNLINDRGKSYSRQSNVSSNSKQKRGIQVTKTLLKKISNMYTDQQFDKGCNLYNNRTSIYQKKKRSQKQQLYNNQTGFMMTTWDSQRTTQQYQLSRQYDSNKTLGQNNLKNSNNILNGLNNSYQTGNYQNFTLSNQSNGSFNNGSLNKISINTNGLSLNNNQSIKQFRPQYLPNQSRQYLKSRQSTQRGSTNSISDVVVKNRHNPNLSKDKIQINQTKLINKMTKHKPQSFYNNIYSHSNQSIQNYQNNKNKISISQDYQQQQKNNYQQNKINNYRDQQQNYYKQQTNQQYYKDQKNYNNNQKNIYKQTNYKIQQNYQQQNNNYQNRPSYHMIVQKLQIKKKQQVLQLQHKGNKMLNQKNIQSKLLKQTSQRRNNYLSPNFLKSKNYILPELSKSSKSLVFNRNKQIIKPCIQDINKSPLFQTAHQILSQQVSSIYNPNSYFHSQKDITGQDLTNYIYGNKSSTSLLYQKQKLQKMAQQQRQKYILRYKNKTFDDLSVKQSLVQGYDNYYF